MSNNSAHPITVSAQKPGFFAAQAALWENSSEIRAGWSEPVLVGTVPSWMGGPAAGEMTAAQIIARFKRGSIMEVFPSELLHLKYNEIENLARQGVRAAQTAYKLLKQTRFNK